MIRFFVLLLVLCLASCNQNGNTSNEETGDNASQPTSEKIPTKSNQDTTAFDLNNFQNLVEKYEDPQRANWQNPELIIEKLGNIKRKTIADIGAGTGYFTFRMAEQGAKVIAIDIDSRFLDYIEDRKADLERNINPDLIETRLVGENDPNLTPKEADIALMVNTYHFLEDRPAYLKKLISGLKNNGRLIIVDYKAGELPVGPAEEFKIPIEAAKKEIENAGLKILEVDSKSLNYQYIITAKP